MFETFQPYLISAIVLLAGILVGFVFEKIVLSNFKRIALKTRWHGDEIIIGAFKGLILVMGIALGGYFSIHLMPGLQDLKVISGKLFLSATVLVSTILVARIVVGFIKAKAKDAAGLIHTGSIIANISRITVFVIGFLVILQTFGVSITPLITALGIGGLAVALALQDTLSNLFSGIQIIASQQIRTGDYIKLDSGEEGYVIDINWRNTNIRMLSNNLIVVPNSKIASAILTNYYLPDKEMGVLVEVSVSYDSDLEKVEHVTIDTACRVIKYVTGAVETFQPFIRYHTFAESSIGFTVILRVKEFTDQYLLKHEFIKALQERYKVCSIEIPFPIRTIVMKNHISN